MFLGVLMALGFLFVSFDASAQDFNSQNDNQLSAKAIAAIRQNCQVSGPMEVSKIEVVSICFASGSVKRVHVISKGHCPGNEPCLIKPLYYGYVEFACGNDVTNVVCAQ